MFESLTDSLLLGQTYTPTNSVSLPHRQFWDPVGLDYERIALNCEGLAWKSQALRTNAKKIETRAVFCGVGAVFLAFIGLIISPFMLVAILIAMYPIMIIQLVHRVKIDVVKYEIAKANNWLYDPEKDFTKASVLSSQFGEVFKRGNTNADYVEDQIHAKIQDVNCYSGVYLYEIETRSSKGRRTVTRYTSSFFMLQMPKKQTASFLLYPENVFSQAANFFTRKEISVESIEFNKRFAFSYNGEKNEKALQIIQTLSPAVQEMLVDLAKKQPQLSVLFKNDVVIFTFKGKILSNPKSTIFHSLKIDPRDTEVFTSKITSYSHVASQIAQYL